MPSNELVSISVGGGEWGGWKNVAYRSQATSPERTFQIVGAMTDVVSLIPGMAFPKPTSWLGQDCTIMSNGNLVMTGYVEDVEILVDEGHKEVRVTGKSRGALAVKSSVDHAKHEMRNVDMLQVAKEIDTAGVGFSSDETLPKIDVVRMNVGDPQIKVLSKLAQKCGMFLCSKRDGGVNITRHGKQRHAGGIIEGINFKSGTARFSIGNRFSKVKVKGHRHKGTGKQSFRYQEEQTDSKARPNTVKVIMPRTDMTRAEAKANAEHVASSRFGDGTSFQTTLQGWRDEGGELWEVGKLVWCEVPSADLSMDLCISELNKTQDETQTLCQIMLVHPSALGSKGSSKKSTKWNEKTGAAWTNSVKSK